MAKSKLTPSESGFVPLIEREGEAAFERGELATDCPYAFKRTPHWETKDYAAFDREYRPRLNQWMKGWLTARDAARKP